MSPLESAIRALCRYLGADPETWEGFRDAGHVAASAFVDALPEDLSKAVRPHLHPQGDPHA